MAEADTDADGYYEIVHNHSGKPARYKVRLVRPALVEVDVVLTSGKQQEVNFTSDGTAWSGTPR